MHDKIVYSSESGSEERLALHVDQNDETGPGGNGVDGKIPDYVANIKKTSKRQSEKCLYILQKVRDLEQWVQKCIAKLRKERSKAEKYLDSAHFIILVLDMNGHVSFINKKGVAALGYTAKEIIGKNWLEKFIPECEWAKFKAIFLQLTAGEDKSLDAFESIIVARDGEERLIEWKSSGLQDNEGNITNILSSGNDITYRKKAEKSQQESSEKIKQFTYFVSHDLKNPAISLIGLTRCLKRKYENLFDEKGKMYCDQIMTTSEHINLLVENINCFASTMEFPLCFEYVDLKEICAAIKKEFYKQLLGRDIFLSDCNKFPLFKMDKVSILRIFRNLIDNALKYGGDTLTTIAIGYKESGDFHVISVGDDGKGFDQKERENIFVAFTRSTSSGDVYGTGLGLAIVKEIAKKHGGNAWAESTLGEGTTFYISIAKNLH
jgi:PAS domain S-box-containing protein